MYFALQVTAISVLIKFLFSHTCGHTKMCLHTQMHMHTCLHMEQHISITNRSKPNNWDYCRCSSQYCFCDWNYIYHRGRNHFPTKMCEEMEQNVTKWLWNT